MECFKTAFLRFSFQLTMGNGKCKMRAVRYPFSLDHCPAFRGQGHHVPPTSGGRSPSVGCALTSICGRGLPAWSRFASSLCLNFVSSLRCTFLQVWLIFTFLLRTICKVNESERPRLRTHPRPRLAQLSRVRGLNERRPAAAGPASPSDFVMDLGMVGDIVLRA